VRRIVEKMPVQRSYGGFTPYHPPASVYATSYTTYNRSPNYGRGSTPGVADSDTDLTSRAPSYGPYRSSYLMPRSEYYNTAHYVLTRPEPPQESRKAIINTDDLDVNAERRVEREHALPGTIRRDTAADLGDRGRQAVKIVTNWQKKALPVGKDGKELTLGQRLALKHLLVDPKQKSPSPSPPPATQRRIASYTSAPKPARLAELEKETTGESDSSDYTWETCSSSEEGPDVKYFPPTPPTQRKKYGGARTVANLATVSRLAESNRQSLDRWSRAVFSESK